MTRKTDFTELGVRKLKPPAEGQRDYFQKLRRGLTLVLRISYGGTKAWRVLYYENGKPVTTTLGHYPELGVAAARKAAFGYDPKKGNAAKIAGSFKTVADDWIKHHVDRKQLRTKREIERHLTKYIYPLGKWGGRPFVEIRRRTVNELLDKIVEKHGASQADGVLTTIRSITNWYATRDEDYVSPIVKGMKRDDRKAADRARARTLTDDELRAVWKAAAELSAQDNSFGAIVRLLLLTAQRREKIATMKWDDVADGVWTIATESREKGNAGVLRLPPVAVAIIEAQPVLDDNPFVFPGSRRGKTVRSGPPWFSSWSQRKAELDERLPAKMPEWTLHDLRRTARSLMARAGVNDVVAERVLGHAISGVEGIYNRHGYLDEKADALSRLATLLDTIVNPPVKTNVVPIAARR